jgi:hypothetical protein
MRRIRWMWHAANTIFFEPICWSPTCVNCAIVGMNLQSFLTRRSSPRKDRFFELNKWSKYICHKRSTVHFGIIWESVDTIEAARISCDCEYAFFALTIKSRLCDSINSH